MQIKTIRCDLDYTKDFDNSVNKALDAGWQIVRRDIIEGELHAELVMGAEPEQKAPTDWRDAIRVLHNLCFSRADDCGNCPILGWCRTNIGLLGTKPHEWVVPYK